MIVMIANSKGGSGRTTTAIMLAFAYSRTHRPVTVIDADPQESATIWSYLARTGGYRLPFAVIPHPAGSDVASMVERAAPESIIIVDTPSHDLPFVQEVSRVSDFVLVPTLPAATDYPTTITTIRALDAPHAVLLTQAYRRAIAVGQWRRQYEEDGVLVVPTVIDHRQFFATIYGDHPPEFLGGYEDVVTDLDTIIDLLQESAAGLRNREAWEDKQGASLFVGLGERAYCPIYDPRQTSSPAL